MSPWRDDRGDWHPDPAAALAWLAVLVVAGVVAAVRWAAGCP